MISKENSTGKPTTAQALRLETISSWQPLNLQWPQWAEKLEISLGKPGIWSQDTEEEGTRRL